MTHTEQTIAEQSAKILVIDDDPITRKMLVKVLSKSGYTVEEAGSGETGLKKIKNFGPEIILLDVVMPGMDGFQTCTQMRKITTYNETPILMLTGLNDEYSVDQAFNVGANDFIAKPINWSLLVKRVRYLVRDRIMNMQLIENEARLRQSQRIAQISYWELNPETSYITISEDFLAKLELTIEASFTLAYFLNLIHQDERSAVNSKIINILQNGQSYQIDHRLIATNGKEYIFQQHAEALLGENGEIIRILGTLQDITQQRHAEALIEYQRNYDDLTKLPNKRSFYHTLDSYLEKNDSDDLFAIILIGIDRFKTINESMGYKTGDIILKNTATRINEIITGHGIVSRYGDDTFAVIINQTNVLEELEILLNVITSALSMPHKINSENVFSTSSIGITLYPLDESKPDQLTANAEIAMNQAKDMGGSRYCYHSPEMNKDAIRKREIEKHIRYGLENDGFQLHYQPQIELRTKKVIGAESLLRLLTADNQYISPFHFIPIAEDTGLIVPLGYWIIESACKQIREWIDSGIINIRYGINLSARQFRDPELVQRLNESVDRYNLPHEVIDLEITESIAMDNMDETLKILHKFKECGYIISMDDFGTGHSSLSYLKQLPIDILKIDREFVKDITADGQNGELAKTIIDMAHNLNMFVIAEGAEDEGHINFLEKNNCDEIQGFYYSKPLPVNEFSEYINHYQIDQLKQYC